MYVLVGQSSPVSALASQDTCRPVETIFARGSGQAHADVDARRFFDQIKERFGESATPHEYELGTETYDGAQYEAVKVNNEAWLNGAGAFVSAGSLFTYGGSVNGGVKELKKYLTERVAKCGDVRIAIGGYSQGAQVARTAANEVPADVKDNIDYVALFGDPKLLLPEGIGPLPPACLGIHSPYRVDVPGCKTYQGSLMGSIPYVSLDMAGKTGLWCNARDIICGSSVPIQGLETHEQYSGDGGPIDTAARIIAERIKPKLPAPVAEFVNTERVFKTGSAGLDTVFVIDTTGSMSGRIAQAKEFARQSAAKIKENKGRVALVAYRDVGDTYTAKIMSGLQSDQADFLSKLDGLVADGGGDAPEALLHALKTGFDGLEWKNGATKAAVILTDTTFHDPDKVDGSTSDSIVKRSLEIDPVNVYPVIPSGLGSHYAALADRTAGQVIVDSGNTVDALTTALTKIINRPVALLKGTEYRAEPGQSIHFDASDSYVLDATITGYDWDFNGDGIFDRHTTAPTTDYAYADRFDGPMQVRVSADNSTIGSASVPVKVGPLSEVAFKVPTAPSNVKITPNSTNPTTATLSWESSDANVAKWVVTVNELPVGTVSAARKSLEIRDLDRAQDIVFTVAGVTADGTVGEPAKVTLAKQATTACPAPSTIEGLKCHLDAMKRQGDANMQKFIEQLRRQ